MTDPLVGTNVAHYEVLAKLGGGGMGVVYSARDQRLGRLVALKCLPPQWSHDEGAKQRFLREAQAASATQHRNICTIHDIETDADGRLFIVMAYYEGQTLKQRLESGPLSIEEAVDVAGQIAEGLAKAHSVGVVHRDIKPGNLMMTLDDVKILDFGLAKFANSLQLTIEGSTLGTVAYMSPEQARGEEADARSDVWAVGVVLYEMLTGNLPFKGAYPEAVSNAIRNESAPPLKVPGHNLPPELIRIVERTLAKDPGERYQTAHELLRDLRLLQGRTVPTDITRPVTPPPINIIRTERWWRSRAALATAAILVIAAIGAPLWILAPVPPVPVVVAAVVNQTGYAELDAYRSALTAELIAELSELSVVRVLPYDRELEILRKFRAAGQDPSSREAIQALTANSGARVVIAPTLLYENGGWRARVEFRDADTATNAAVENTAPVVSSLVKDTAYGLVPALGETIDRHFVSAGPPRLALAQALRRALGRASYVPAKRLQTLDAAARFEEGLDAYARFEYEDARTAFAAAAVLDPRNALLAAWRSRVATMIRRDDEASEMATQAVRLTSDGLSPRARLFVESVVAEVRHDFTTAEARLRDVIEADPANPAAMMELGFFLDRRLDTPRAIETFSGALKADARMPRAHLELCRMYSPARQNESANAVTQGNQALSAYRALGDRSGEAQALMCLVDTLRVGNPSDRQTAKQSADTARAILEADRASYQLPRAHYYVALVFGAEGNLSAAAEAFETSLAKAQAGGNVLLQPLLQMNLGVAHTALGHHARAAQYYSDSSKAYEVLGDEQRAAQIQANASALAIEYGPDPTQGLREMQNALSVSRKLGDKNFEVFCLQVIAAYYRDAGDQAASERSLNQALAISRERNLNHHVVPLTVDIARSRLETGDYATAKTLLMQALGDGKGPAAVQSRLYLAHVDIHLGDFASANEELMTAAREVEGGGDTELTPLLHELRGELSYESGHLNDARAHFAAASQLWTDDRPDAASVEARAYLGLLDGLSGQADQGMRQIRESLEQAQRMERLGLQAQCRVFLARVALHARRPDDANIALQGVAADGERAVGRELQAQVHYWRSQVQAVHSDRTQQASESDAARKLLRDLQQSLPDPDRARFGARPDVQMILG